MVGSIAGLLLSAVLAQAHAASHHIVRGNESCSATAIGPHALLTAEHCIKDQGKFTIDNLPSTFSEIILDNYDHAILIVDKTFNSVAKLGNPPNVGDPIFIFGNPYPYMDVLREGIVSGYTHSNTYNTSEILYDLNGFFGDSGSGVYNKDGLVVEVMNQYVTAYGPNNFEWHQSASLPLHFTSQQISEALSANNP